MFVALQIVRLIAIVALLCVAAAITTPKNRLPLALRGLAKLVALDRGQTQSTADEGCRLQSVSTGKRAFALFLVILAILLALI